MPTESPGASPETSSYVGHGARLDALLTELMRRTPELEAAAVVTVDGLPMASALPPQMDEDRVAAMSAALLSLGERAAEGLGRGELSQVHIQGESGGVWLLAAGEDAVLVGVSGRRRQGRPGALRAAPRSRRRRVRPWPPTSSAEIAEPAGLAAASAEAASAAAARRPRAPPTARPAVRPARRLAERTATPRCRHRRQALARVGAAGWS